MPDDPLVNWKAIPDDVRKSLIAQNRAFGKEHSRGFGNGIEKGLPVAVKGVARDLMALEKISFWEAVALILTGRARVPLASLGMESNVKEKRGAGKEGKYTPNETHGHEYQKDRKGAYQAPKSSKPRQERTYRLPAQTEDIVSMLPILCREINVLKPWQRSLPEFFIDIHHIDPAIRQVVVNATLGTPQVSCSTAIGSVVVTDIDDAERCDVEWAAQDHSHEDRLMYLAWDIGICALLAVRDLLTVEVKRVEAGRGSKKHARPTKRWPAMGVVLPPVIVAPRQVLVRDAFAILGESESHAAPESVEDKPRDSVDSVVNGDAQRTYYVSAHKRGKQMSIRHRKELLDKMAEGWRPVDKFGNEIPLPDDGAYTIVTEHKVGNATPEVISRSVLDVLAPFASRSIDAQPKHQEAV